MPEPVFVVHCSLTMTWCFADALELLSGLPVDVDPETSPRAWAEILALGRTYGLTAYDGAYLELALRRQLPLAAIDNRLRQASQAAGVAPYQP